MQDTGKQDAGMQESSFNGGYHVYHTAETLFGSVLYVTCLCIAQDNNRHYTRPQQQPVYGFGLFLPLVLTDGWNRIQENRKQKSRFNSSPKVYHTAETLFGSVLYVTRPCIAPDHNCNPFMGLY